MKNRTRLLTTVVVASLALGGAAAANASQRDDDHHRKQTSTLARDFEAVTRDTVWQLTGKQRLSFPTFHTEGIAFSRDHIFLSSVEILEPTVKYPAPQGGYDRTPGKGVGHLFVMDRDGTLQKDIVLGEGDAYHPGGIDFDGTNVWVPVAEYRPNSRAIVYRVDARSLAVHRQFEVRDHFGGVVLDKTTGHLIGNTWGSRRFAEWDLRGRQLRTWQNPSFFVDYQDCQYVPAGAMMCAGVTNLPQTPTAGDTVAS